MDRLRAIEVFIAAADAGSFSAAGQRLGLSPVMVGKYVQWLEQHLGARLLERSTRRQRLTDAGRRFHEEGQRVLDQMRTAEQAIDTLTSTTPRGRLRISAATTVGECVVAGLAVDFQAAHPQVAIELEVGNSVVDLLEENFDLAIRVGTLDPALNLIARPLGFYRMGMYASPAYLDARGTPVTPADLPQHRCLGHLVWNARNTWQVDLDGTSVQWPITALSCNSSQALRQAALRGAGLLLQPAVLVAEDVRRGMLVPVLQDYLPTPRPVHALYRHDRHRRPALVSFIDYLQAHAANALA